ncbi:MAG: DUF6438 domain-containing protein [Chitinophagales bacterium]|nr:hypothetical protein [Bacteroidota bacterium]MCB9042878.1 hypothetical protein [Chitinophagales bacterium]
MQYYIFFLFALLLSACTSNNKDTFDKNNLLGNWILVAHKDFPKETPKPNELIPPPIIGIVKKSYVFLENDSCINRIGYTKRLDWIKHTYYNPLFPNKTGIIYLGDKTIYQIVNDSLEIYNLSYNNWQKYKILLLTKDTLRLSFNKEKATVIETYARKTYSLDSSETYDEIIVSSSGCYGECPISNTLFTSNGNILYFGETYNYIDGFYTAKITPKTYQDIESRFKMANISALNKNYYADWTDDETVSVSFVRDHCIVKTVSDYGRQAPTEFIWAYTYARYFHQNLQLTPFVSQNPYLPKLIKTIRREDDYLRITDSELFFLQTEILGGKMIANKSIENTYSLLITNDCSYKEMMFSDGRFFQISDQNDTLTIDIGYNFFVENNIVVKKPAFPFAVGAIKNSLFKK